MAVDNFGVWGIDLGQCGLKAIRLEERDGEVFATAFDYIEHPKILSQPDADPDELTREALEQFLARNTIKGDKVVISVPGQSGLARFVKLPPVEEKKIADIVRFEAKQQIPFPLEEVVWDFQRLGAGIVTDGFAMEAEIGLFAMKRDMINRYMQHFKDVHVEVHLIQMAPLGLCNYVAHDILKKEAKADGEEDDDNTGGKKKCVVALDIGTDSSNLIITDGEKIIWQRPIPIGGNHFTRAMTKDLKLTFAKAEHLKRNAMKSPHLKKILGAIKAVLNDFVGEVQRSLGYFTNTHRDAEIEMMIGMGNAFRLPGLQKYLQEKLGLEVRKLQKFERLDGEEVTTAPQFKENIMTMAVAYGCALQGLEKTRLRTNLLPEEVRVERAVRAKKPWAAVAAAVLLFTVALLALGRHLEASKVKMTDAIKNEDQAINQIKTKIANSETEFQKEVTRIKENESALDEISSGSNIRHQWFQLFRYINSALPRRDGTNLLATEAIDGSFPKEKYFTTEAKKALNLLNAKRAVKPGTPPPDAKTAEAVDRQIKENLIQINIESITSRYSDDLHSYFKNVYERTKQQLPGMRLHQEELIKKLAAGKATDDEKHKIPMTGWVVEIRGFTFHKKEKFVRHTLVENLAGPEKVGLVWDKKKVDDLRKDLKKFDQDWNSWSDVKKTKWELSTKLNPRIGYVYLLLNERIEKPKTKNFVYINQSYLSDAQKLFTPVLPAAGAAKQPGDANPQPGQPPGEQPGFQQPGFPQPGVEGVQPNPAAVKKDRSKFRALGEVAGKMQGQFQGNADGNFGKVPGGDVGPNKQPVAPGGQPNAVQADGKDNVPLFPRTEFVIHFVWQERMIGEPVLPITARKPVQTQPVNPGF